MIQKNSKYKELSIIIPCKNEKKYIGSLLYSLSKQSYDIHNTPIFIADAKSTDTTLKVIKKCKKKYNLKIKVIRGGLPPFGRNAGARHCKSKYILFIDADMYLSDNELIKRSISLIKKKSLSCVTTNIYCKGDILANVLYFLNNCAQKISNYFSPYATGMFMLFERKRFFSLKGFDEKVICGAEDYHLSKKLRKKEFDIVPGHILTTNRRFKKIGYLKVALSFIKGAINSNNKKYFYKDNGYWSHNN